MMASRLPEISQPAGPDRRTSSDVNRKLILYICPIGHGHRAQ